MQWSKCTLNHDMTPGSSILLPGVNLLKFFKRLLVLDLIPWVRKVLPPLLESLQQLSCFLP